MRDMPIGEGYPSSFRNLFLLSLLFLFATFVNDKIEREISF